VHHCDSWIKDQLDVTCYFISLLMCSTCFGHQYIHHQELATILLNYHIGHIVLGLVCVGVSVWLGWNGIRVAGWSLQHFLYAQHVSDINISIIRSLRLFCWITTLVVLFLVRCVLEFRCCWVGVVSVLQAYHQELATILLNYHIGRIVLGSMWLGWSGIRVAGWSLKLNPTTPKLQHTPNQEQYDQCGNSTE